MALPPLRAIRDSNADPAACHCGHEPAFDCPSEAAKVWNAALDACDAIAAERAPAAVHFKDLLTKDLRARVTP